MGKVIGSLKIDNGVRRIEVNDNGDFIEFNISDRRLFERFNDMLSWFVKKQQEIVEYGDVLKEKYEGRTDRAAYDEAAEEMRAITSDVIHGCVVQIDSVFGTGTSGKVFGEVIEHVDFDSACDMITQFFTQLTPIMGKMAAERKARFSSKYSAGRKGGM